MAADAKVGSDLIRVQAIDNDIGNNSLVLYHILSIRYIKLHSNDSEDMGNVFIIGLCALHTLQISVEMSVYLNDEWCYF